MELGVPESLQLPLTIPSIFHCLVLVPVFVHLLLWTYRHLTGRQKPKQLPGPVKLPIIGNLHQLGGHAPRSLKSLADVHGPLMLVHMGTVPYLIVSSPSAAKEVLKTHDMAFSGRTATFVGERALYNCRDIAFSPYGEDWRQARRVSVVHLLSLARVRSARVTREEEVAAMLGKINVVSNQSKEVNLTEMLQEMSKNFSCRTALGKKYHSTGSGNVGEMLANLMDQLGHINIGDYIPLLAWVNKFNGFESRVEKNSRELDRLLERVLEEHAVGEIERGSFVDVLLCLEKENSAAGGYCLGRDRIKAAVLDMFLGGSQTGFSVMDWTMSELMRNPELMAKAQAEVRAIAIADGKGNKLMVDEDDVEKMAYLKCVLKEVLRLHPPLPLLVPRESIADVTLLGLYSLPKGTRVIVNAWAIARDPERWEKPEEFLPERFKIDDPTEYAGTDFNMIPFGAGRRGCPGMNFAVALIELAVANLLYRFDFELPKGVRPEDMDMTEASGFTGDRKSELLLVATPYPI